MVMEDKKQSGLAQPVWIGNYADFINPPADVAKDNLALSEFGESRSVIPGNRSDVEFLYGKQPLLFDETTTNAGSVTHDPDSRDLTLAVNDAVDGTEATMRQHYWVPYTPGSGQEIDISGTMDYTGIGGGSLYAFLRSSVTGTTTLQTEPLNIDGLDLSMSQIFRMSFQSLRVGRIQYSIVRSGILTKVAEITNDNIRATGYWQYAGLPPYWKIYNTATNTIVEFGYGDELNGIGFLYELPSVDATAACKAICCTVKSQGGVRLFDMYGFPFSADSDITPKVLGATWVPLLSIRNKTTFNGLPNRSLVVPMSLDITTDQPIMYKLVYRPSLTGASWVDVSPSSSVEYDVSATSLTGGVEFYSGYAGSGKNNSVSEEAFIGRVIMSYGVAPDVLTLYARGSDTISADVFSIIRWREIR